MSSHRNLWKPDTCGCVIEFEFDDELPAEQRVHTGHTVHKICESHKSALEGKDAHTSYQHCSKENQKKNLSIGLIEESLSDEHFDIKEDWDGNVTKTLKWQPRFSFDSDRKLKIELHRSHKHLLTNLKKKVQDKFPDVLME